VERLWPLKVAVDRAVRQRKRTALTPQDLTIDIPNKEFSGLLGISNLARAVKEVPSDLKRAFYKDR
jgi:hypothetical protein